MNCGIADAAAAEPEMESRLSDYGIRFVWDLGFLGPKGEFEGPDSLAKCNKVAGG